MLRAGILCLTLLTVVDFFGVHIVVSETVNCDLLPHRPLFAVVAVGVNRYAAAGRKFPPYLNILGVHKPYQIFHNDVHTVLVKVPVIAEAIEIKLQRLAFHHSLRGDVGNIHRRKIGLTRYRAQARKLGTVEFHEIIVVLVHV